MEINKFLLLIFIFSTHTSSAQIDSSEKKPFIIKHEKDITDSSQIVKKFDNEIQQEKTSHKNSVINQGGIEDSVTASVVTSGSIQILKDSIKSLEKENSKLGNKLEKLESAYKVLQTQIDPKTSDKEKDKNKTSHFSLLYFLIIFLLAIAFVLFFLFKGGRNKLKSLLLMKMKQQQQKIIIKTQQDIPQQTITPSPLVETQEVNTKTITDVNWFVVGASSIGKSHLASNKPCQDYHFYENIGYGWGIAISCDGAGSAENSHLGSEFTAKRAFKNFKEFIMNNNYPKKNFLPSDKDWKTRTDELFKKLHKELGEFAKSKQMEITSVACTVIVVIYSPVGLLVAHLGDGRAGYCNEKGEWNSIITPHKGEEANQTIFISSKAWQNGNELVMSGVTVPESRVIREKPIAFTLMSDGCESHSFECSIMDTRINKWHDPNIPFSKFFNPLVEQLKVFNISNYGLIEANEKWRKFVEEGTPGLKEESDDKTLILGILI